jgi:hypothetical protein
MAELTFKEVLEKHGWRYIGNVGNEEGWELPDAYVVSIFNDIWHINCQWDAQATCVAAGKSAAELDEELKEDRYK